MALAWSEKTGHVQLMSTLVIRILPGWRLAQVGPLQFLVAPLSFTGTLGTMCHAWFVGSRGLQACLYIETITIISWHIMSQLSVWLFRIVWPWMFASPGVVCVCACVLPDLHATIYQFVLLQWLFSSAEPWGVICYKFISILQIEIYVCTYIYVYIIWYDMIWYNIYIYNN
jgi:hypothetical protein